MKKFILCLLPLTLLSCEEEMSKLSVEPIADTSMDNRMMQSSYAQRPLVSSQKSAEPWGVSIKGDWLFWTSQEDGLDYALDRGVFVADYATGSAVVETALPGKVKSLPIKWNSGFRVDAAYLIPDQCWDLLLRFTRFTNGSDKSEEAFGSSNEDLSPLWVIQGDGFTTSINNVSAKWNLKYSVLDFEMGRSFNPVSHFSIRPYAGVRGVWINQHFDIAYSLLNSDEIVGATGTDYFLIDNKNNFQGAGLRMGVTPVWNIYCGWSIVANGAFSLIYGDFDLYQTQTELLLPGTSSYFADGGSIPLVNLGQQFHSVAEAIECGLGVKWETSLWNNASKLEFYAGWEQNLWLNQNQMFRFTACTSALEPLFTGCIFHQQGNLSFQGVDVYLRLSF